MLVGEIDVQRRDREIDVIGAATVREWSANAIIPADNFGWNDPAYVTDYGTRPNTIR